jgi:hypothetical protein
MESADGVSAPRGMVNLDEALPIRRFSATIYGEEGEREFLRSDWSSEARIGRNYQHKAPCHSSMPSLSVQLTVSVNTRGTVLLTWTHHA